MKVSGKTRLWTLFRHSFAELKKNDPLRMAGATSFFATFAIPPIIIILFQLFTIFLSRQLVGPEMAQILSDTLGPDTARQIRITTRGFRTMAQTWYTAAAGFVFLIFIATTLFVVIKNTLNVIWKVRVKERRGFLFYLRLRARSFLVILSAGVLFLAGLLLDGLEVLAGKYIDKIIPGGGVFFYGLHNEVFGAGKNITRFIQIFS
ncbi:MAG: YhjD/YihY/BrkB family envelope integrity protein [Chitinophagaceae bacterium]